MSVPFTVIPSVATEVLEGGPATVLSEKNALAKVDGAILPPDVPAGAFVLGTDTLVSLDDRVMGKPASAEEAAQMLARLSGRTHKVVSGIALRRLGRSREPGVPNGPLVPNGPGVASGPRRVGGPGVSNELSARAESSADSDVQVASATTHVTFLPLQRADIEAYIASFEWKGKAGAYAIQGLAGSFVCEVRGEYSNVVGLPLCLLGKMFKTAGFDLLRRMWV